MSRSGGRNGGLTPAARTALILVMGGLALAGGLWRIRVIAADFVYNSPMLDRPILELVGILIGLGLIHVAIAGTTLRAHVPLWLIAGIVVLGAAMRAFFFGANPILEDDHYRYRWDGAVTAHGLNPYTVAPRDVSAMIDTQRADLARESGEVIRRVNHPSLTTVYPPVAQAAFGIAYAIEPWSLDAWRAVLFGIELVVCAMLLFALRTAGRPLHWLLIYWWNPLAIMMTANAAHMDVVALPFVLAAVLFAARNRAIAAAVAGALAVCAKLWPLVLAPLLLRNLRAAPGRLAIAGLIGGCVALAVGSPMYVALEQDRESGFAAYGSQWEMNDALFMVLLGAARTALSAGDPAPETVQAFARGLVVAIVALVLALLSVSRAPDSASLFNRLAILLGVLFMLLPAQFPWYYLWVLPFLTVAPRASLLSLTVTLPIYYLRFWYAAHDNADFFHTRVVWIEYAPCLILAGIEFGRYLVRSVPRA